MSTQHSFLPSTVYLHDSHIPTLTTVFVDVHSSGKMWEWWTPQFSITIVSIAICLYTAQIVQLTFSNAISWQNSLHWASTFENNVLMTCFDSTLSQATTWVLPFRLLRHSRYWGHEWL